MSTAIIVVIVVVVIVIVIVIGAVVFGVMPLLRRRRLQNIQPLTDAAQARYAEQWESIQEQFVDVPADASYGAHMLVVAVMTEHGYPVEDARVLADPSVEHSGTLDRYRAAEEISHRATAGTAFTEDLRQAINHSRALFGDLLGEPVNAGSGSAADAMNTNEQGAGPDPKEMAK
jgi:cytochrome P450